MNRYTNTGNISAMTNEEAQDVTSFELKRQTYDNLYWIYFRA